MKIAIQFSLVLAVFFSVSCDVLDPYVHKPDLPKLVEIRGAPPDVERKIRDAFSVLPDKMQRSVNLIRVRNDENHFYFIDDKKEIRAAAHYCGREPKTICIRGIQYVQKIIVWHEAAHAYTFALSNQFRMEWKAVAGSVFEGYGSGGTFPDPADGLLTAYSRKNELEDIAEWVEQCYAYLYETKSSILLDLYKGYWWAGREMSGSLKNWNFCENGDF